jgi:hypothetical protein
MPADFIIYYHLWWPNGPCLTRWWRMGTSLAVRGTAGKAFKLNRRQRPTLFGFFKLGDQTSLTFGARRAKPLLGERETFACFSNKTLNAIRQLDDEALRLLTELAQRAIVCRELRDNYHCGNRDESAGHQHRPTGRKE